MIQPERLRHDGNVSKVQNPKEETNEMGAWERTLSEGKTKFLLMRVRNVLKRLRIAKAKCNFAVDRACGLVGRTGTEKLESPRSGEKDN